MFIFIAIAVASFIFLASSFIFGHDHDHDVGHDHDASHDHDSGHGGGETTISIWSTKVLFTFSMLFGATGAIAMHEELSVMNSSLIGASSGLAVAALMYFILRMIYSQQASTVVHTANAKGLQASVTTTIPVNGQGMIDLMLEGRYVSMFARSTAEIKEEIPRGSLVKVVEADDSGAIVELFSAEKSADVTN